ncbi:MAG TPA: hypothetical protein VIJ01_19065 [Candidatus Angelobacter sp.]
MTGTQHSSNERTTTYATSADFCRIFKEDMTGLYSLSLMLAADPEKAEQLFVSGLDDCVASNPVFKEWARSWARRVIVKAAVRLIAPGPASANGGSSNATNRALPEMPPQIHAVLELGGFERFAFILSVLEGYSDQDSALLLGCTRQSLIVARVRAEQQIARSVAVLERRQAEAIPNNHESAIESALPALLAIPA